MSASRLPGKPLLKINGISIIQHVYNKAKATNLGKVYVATEDAEIQTEIEKNGGNSIMTSKNHQTGTDRIFECFEKLDLSDIDYIINLQGDEPLMNIEDIRTLHNKMIKTKSKVNPLDFFTRLSKTNLAPEAFMIKDKNYSIISCSPENLITKKGSLITTTVSYTHLTLPTKA
mgnify:CR=1 FL=1